jgi:RNA polymerase-binding transcription factor
MTMKPILSLPTVEDLRMRLECDRDRLKEQITDLRAAEGANRPQESVAWGKEVTDQADQGMDQAEWDRLHIEELALADRLAEVEHALAKVPLGAYGMCEACGQPIPEARLQELPAARFDLEHEVALEERIDAQEQLPEPGF